MKDSKLIETDIKLDLWAFVKVRKANETQRESVIIITKKSSYFQANNHRISPIFSMIILSRLKSGVCCDA